jgi:hypothetical protein
MACANGVGEVRLVGPVGIHYEDIVVPCWTIARRREKDFRAVRRPGRGKIVICVGLEICVWLDPSEFITQISLDLTKMIFELSGDQDGYL